MTCGVNIYERYTRLRLRLRSVWQGALRFLSRYDRGDGRYASSDWLRQWFSANYRLLLERLLYAKALPLHSAREHFPWPLMVVRGVQKRALPIDCLRQSYSETIVCFSLGYICKGFRPLHPDKKLSFLTSCWLPIWLLVLITKDRKISSNGTLGKSKHALRAERWVFIWWIFYLFLVNIAFRDWFLKEAVL